MLFSSEIELKNSHSFFGQCINNETKTNLYYLLHFFKCYKSVLSGSFFGDLIGGGGGGGVGRWILSVFSVCDWPIIISVQELNS